MLSQRGRPCREKAAPGPGSPEVQTKMPPQMKTGGKADQSEKRPHQTQTGGKAILDGPKSSHPPVVGEKGGPLANPPQMQTEGPVNMLNSSNKVAPCLALPGDEFLFSSKLNKTQTYKLDCGPVSPCSNGTQPGTVAVHGNTAFSSIPCRSVTSPPTRQVRKQIRENRFQTTL